MPPVNKKSGLAAKYGAKLDTAVKNHGADETTYGIIELPPGISNGIAHLFEAKFDVYKTGQYQGEYYFHARGTVLAPKSVQTAQGEIPVEGLQTSITLPCCETKNQKGEVTSLEDNIAAVLNEFRKLGVDTTNFTANDLEATAEVLKTQSLGSSPIYFRFSTSQSAPTPAFPNPRVWQNWHGIKGLEDFQPDTEGAVDDGGAKTAAPVSPPVAPKPTAAAPKPTTPAKPATAPTKPAAAAVPAKPAAAPAKPAAKKPEPPKAPEPPPAAVPSDEFGELTDLVGLADAGDDDAQTKLANAAREAGITDDQMKAADSWAAVAQLITGAQGGEAPAEEPAAEAPAEGGEAEWKPAVEEVYGFEPPLPGGKKGKKIEVEITAVDEATKTCSMKSLDDPKKTWTKQGWDKLQSA